MIKKLRDSFSFAINGLVITWKEEINFRIETFIALAVLISLFYFDFSFPEMIIVMLVITLVLSAEIINTAVEDLCNKVEPNEDPLIKKVKDIMSAFVLVLSFGALLVGVLVFYNHFL